jgi:hypothetical protein
MPNEPHTRSTRRRLGTVGSASALAALTLLLGCTGQVEGNAGPPGNPAATGGAAGTAATGGTAGIDPNIGQPGVPVDTDGDGIPDGLDVDGDGIPDGIDTDGDGIIDMPMPPVDMPDPPLDNSPDGVAAACAALNGTLNTGVTRLRRITRSQFNNTVRDLLGASGTPADALVPDEHIGPFQSNAIAPVTELLVEQHQEIAKALAQDAVSRMDQIVSSCDLAADEGTTCATQFVTEFGLRAYRRPLTAAEVTPYVELYTLGKQGGGAENGFRLVVEAMLQAPSFLYHADVGGSGTPSATPVPLTPYELSSRLSYFLWNTMPDAELFALAGDGSLSQDSVISAQVARMLNDPKAGHTIGMFHTQWLGLEDLGSIDKDEDLFPQFSPELLSAMVTETELFSDYVVRQGDGLLKTLLTSNLAFPQGELFGVYGATQPAGYELGTPVALDASQRAGILTQAAFLTRKAHRNQSSPVHRGLLVRENVLCQPIEAPPAEVNNTPPPVTPSTSTRQRFAQHTADASCAGCHLLMDPIGLGFENFDALGQWRTVDGLGPVDATGSFEEVQPDLAGNFTGAVELANKLANSEEVTNCFSVQWFRFSLGRIEATNDACSIKAIREGFQASGGNIKTLLAQIALSDAFRNVRGTAQGN